MNQTGVVTTKENTNPFGRREFLVTSAGGFSLGFFLPGFSRLNEIEAEPLSTVDGTQINAWIKIGADESITVTVGAAEMGQGSMSSLPQIVAEELMVDYANVSALQAPASQAYLTAGSGTVRNQYLPLRRAGAAAREMLIQAAMNLFGGARADYSVTNGIVTNTKTNASITYGQLAPAAALLPVPPITPTWPPLVPDSDFKLIGKALPRLDIPSKTNGSAVFGLDVRLPGMVYAVIKHCPSFGGTLAKLPSKPSGALAVVATSVIPASARGSEVAGNANAVAVVAANTWDAWQMAKQLKVSWNIPASSASIDSATFQSQAQSLMASGTPYIAEKIGDPATALAGSSKMIDVTYSLPYVAHACMEVLNCTVNLTPTSCEVWAPTQGAGIVVSTVTAITGLAANQVTVHTTYLGGGLGRKIEQDYIAQAVQIAKAIGKPVKLMWPREEDFTRDQYRPMALIRGRAGLDDVGNIVSWSYRTVSPSILSQRGRALPVTGDSQATEAATALPYNFAARTTEYVVHPSPVPVGFWRSVGASLNTFAVESMMDELAKFAGEDPYLFRRNRLTDPRWIAVLDAAAQLGGWNTPVPSGRARGIAISKAFNSIVAEVFEISQTTSGVKIHKVACAIDCGRPVNPDSIKAQMQGGIVHGINATLWGQQTFKAGAAVSKNFNRSRMMRLNEMPVISVTILPPNPNVPIGGIGEPAVPPVAPALANAYAKLTGQRIRALPFFPNATMGGL
ncbi:MAG: xanthine dehydrogenase family protein molybdopterin-binding subunit [Acidobacteria bacterium]|nr:xanthine dehydrogenase family protein molybdopterin-binding subunit [Acidobacteriota bacterium]